MSYQFPKVEAKDALEWSGNITAYTMLRNIQGPSADFGGTLRRLAYRSSLQNRPLKMIEVTFGLPSVALEFLNPAAFRMNGDYLRHYSGSAELDEIAAASQDANSAVNTGFDTPSIMITAVSPRDYLMDILSGANLGFDGSAALARISSILCNNRSESTQTLRQKYQEAKSKGVFRIHESGLAPALDTLCRQGESYDLAICNQLMYAEDRIGILQTLQSVLSPGGIAYIPLTWWSPAYKGPAHEGYLMADEAYSARTYYLLEDYLSAGYPAAFEVGRFPGVKALIVKGTPQPVKLPTLKPEIIAPRVSKYSRNHAEFYPDMPVISWKESE